MKWSRQEVNLLTKEYQRGTSLRKISELVSELGEKRTYNAIINEIRNLNLKRKHETLTSGKRVGHLDIESNQLNASFGIMLSWAIKEDGKDIIHTDVLTKSDFAVANKLEVDKRIITSLSKKLQDFDVITTYNGEYFDLPYIRSRALKHSVEFPEYGNIISIDVWKIARAKMKLYSHRLDVVAEHLGVNSKTKLDPDIWVRAVFQDMKALAEIARHNREDVITLEKVYNKLKTYSAGVRRSI